MVLVTCVKNLYSPDLLVRAFVIHRLPVSRLRYKQKDLVVNGWGQLAVSYVAGLSETKHTKMYHKLFNMLRVKVVHPKDKTAKDNQCGTIYHNTPTHTYVGVSKRLLSVRFNVQLYIWTLANLLEWERCFATGHSVSMSNMEALTGLAWTCRNRAPPWASCPPPPPPHLQPDPSASIWFKSHEVTGLHHEPSAPPPLPIYNQILPLVSGSSRMPPIITFVSQILLQSKLSLLLVCCWFFL